MVGELMPKDDRNLLEVLKFELEFLEQGGYGRLPRESWKPRFIFEDSPTCMNFNSKDHEPCEECLLMQFVPEKRARNRFRVLIFRCRRVEKRWSLCTELGPSRRLRKRLAPGCEPRSAVSKLKRPDSRQPACLTRRPSNARLPDVFAVFANALLPLRRMP